MMEKSKNITTANLSYLSRLTPARLAVGRAGSRPRFDSWLSFRKDHALARDAVLGDLKAAFIKDFAQTYDLLVVQSQAGDRKNFVLNPPSGKRLKEDEVAEVSAQLGQTRPDVQIVMSDGLSALALEENLPDLYPMLLDGFKQEGITMGKAVIALQGRVAIADQIGYLNGAKIAINLIGERPGLSTAKSLSAYITYNPSPSTISSDRTVVSNIHQEGTPPVEAGAFIVKTVKRILDLKVSGVKLQALS